MNLVLCGEAQCQVCPRPLLSPSRKKVSPSDGAKGRAWSREVLWAYRHLSHPSVLSPLSPAWGSRIQFSHGLLSIQPSRPQPWPQVHGHGHDCSKRWLPMAARVGQPTNRATQETFHTLLNTWVPNSETTFKLNLYVGFQIWFSYIYIWRERERYIHTHIHRHIDKPGASWSGQKEVRKIKQQQQQQKMRTSGKDTGANMKELPMTKVGTFSTTK